MEHRKYTPLMYAHQAHIHLQGRDHRGNELEDFIPRTPNVVALEVQPGQL
jgi:hypothetical protein